MELGKEHLDRIGLPQHFGRSHQGNRRIATFVVDDPLEIAGFVLRC